jgi:hypothetical protein
MSSWMQTERMIEAIILKHGEGPTKGILYELNTP